MPIREHEIGRLTNDELLQIVDTPAFSGQREQLLRELLSRNGINPVIFKGLHIQPACEIVRRRAGSATVRHLYVNENMVADEIEHSFRLVCLGHNVKSAKFIDNSSTQLIGAAVFR